MRLNLSADDLLSTTRAVRKRLDLTRPVERFVLTECLDLAVQAPTGSNRQTWQWVIVTDVAIKRELARIYRTNFERYVHAANSVSYDSGDLRGEQRPRVTASSAHLSDHLHEVPVMLIPCIEADLTEVSRVDGASAWGSLLPAVWSFMLAARERGLGSAWTTLHMRDGGDVEAADLLGIPHERFTQAGLFPVAYTIGQEFKPARRISIEPLVHWNRW